MIVVPPSRSRCTSRHMSRRKATSTPAVGSSRNRTSGSCASALAISTRRFMPPDSAMILVERLSHNDSDFSTRSTTAGSRGLPNSPREKATVPATVSNMSVESSCGTSPIRSRACRQSARMSLPSTRIVPPVGRTSPHTAPISVVLPAPFGPSSAKISPRRMSRSTDASASCPDA